MAVMDDILCATGGPTINDGLRSWYTALTRIESLQDAERRWLLGQAATSTGTNQDLWGQFLTDAGYTGSVNDQQASYWRDQCAASGGANTCLDFVGTPLTGNGPLVVNFVATDCTPGITVWRYIAEQPVGDVTNDELDTINSVNLTLQLGSYAIRFLGYEEPFNPATPIVEILKENYVLVD